MQYKCPCGNPYTPLPDEEATDLPPTMSARLFHCPVCGGLDWCEAEDFGLEDWPEAEH